MLSVSCLSVSLMLRADGGREARKGIYRGETFISVAHFGDHDLWNKSILAICLANMQSKMNFNSLVDN